MLIGLDDKQQKNDGVLSTNRLYQGFDCYTIPTPKTVFEWSHHMHSISEFIKVIEHYGIHRVKAVVAMEYEAIALWKLTRFCNKNGIDLIADAEEWYEQSNLPFPHNVAKDFDTNLRMYFVYPKRIKKMIAISRFLADYYKDKVETVVYVPVTIDKSELKWNLLPSYKANDVFTIGYAGFPGHKMEKERIDWLVRAVCDLNEDGKPCRLLIAGCDRKIVEDFDPTIVNYSSYTHSVQYLGYLGHQDCLRMLASCDFSAIVREDKRVTKAGFPTKLSESLGCGTPVISTPFSNISEYVINGFNGFVTTDFSMHSLKEAIELAMRLSRTDLEAMHKRTKEENPLTYDRFTHVLETVIRP